MANDFEDWYNNPNNDFLNVVAGVLNPWGAVDQYARTGSFSGLAQNQVQGIRGITDRMNPENSPAQTALMNQFYNQGGQIGQYNVNQGAFGTNPQLDQAYGLMQGQAGGNDPVRAQQMGLIQQLQDQAAGRGPSLAQMQLQQATNQNMQQGRAMAASQRGLGGGAAARQIAGQRGSIGQQMAGQSAMARLQEQMAARGMLGQQLGGVRGQDMSAMGALAQQAEANRRAQMEYEQLRSQNQNAFNQTASQNIKTANELYNAPRERQQGNFGILGNIVGSAAKMILGGG